ncbi:hypothetical protein [Dolichospermum circinale]|uniref:Uncharacterized protein n=1 Tax=Dolichospermum circinale CS-537/01 TaxID=3021739 RepID=A0ABT5A6K6_9CYAN|nr:hypothetical protein [Dolichospermum circinale]MDB9458946.1 hypothetical protein [Dolichospermum circinale CS-545/17]MDB9454655.1 hypothetical protein [Dolichospermum circinale CS-541/06]MDB9461446.1 hypothetical protein [Dolichospermum circinale CS-541/04]MDB9466514.1 hypothetical protein [Dolichospermum circinale CS-539/09]MDB9472061.1 hypothetical protein [Dolichospermum circinale CS-539]
MELFVAIALGTTIFLSPSALLVYAFLKSCEKGRLKTLENLSNHPELVELSEIRNDYSEKIVELDQDSEPIKKKSFLEIMF